MTRYIFKRLVQGIFVLVGVSILIFLLSRIIPGDPARLALGQRASAEAVETLRRQIYLDKPLPMQYLLWMRDVLRGNFGISLMTKRSVTLDLIQFLPATMELVICAGIIEITGSLILGRLAAKYHDGLIDNLVRILAYAGIAIPSFIMAILLLVLFGNMWKIFPVLGRLSTGIAEPARITGMYVIDALLAGNPAAAWDAALHLILPAFALALGGLLQEARLMRSALVDNMNKEYMSVSKSYGLPEKLLLNKYLFKTSSTSVITVMGMDVAYMVGSAFLVEKIFSWPGLSKYGVNAMISKDLNAICAVVLVIGAAFLLVNLIVDVINASVDPRIRLGS